MLNKKMRTFKISFIIIFCLVVIVMFYQKYNNRFASSLWDNLDFFGFNSLEQKQSLEYLMQISGALKKEESFVSRFPKRTNAELLLQDTKLFVELTKKYFTNRINNQERWQIKPSKWMIEHQENILIALKKIGIIDQITPNNIKPDLVAVLGATNKTMKLRFNYLNDLVENHKLTIKYLALLAGERKAQLGIDGPEQELETIAKNHGMLSGQLTEYHIMLDICAATPVCNKLPINNRILINTVAINLARPTTKTTVQDLFKQLQKPEYKDIKTITFISNQPHVKYQQAIIRGVLKQQEFHDIITFEVIGPELDQNQPIKIQELISELGAQIWATAPSVEESINLLLKTGRK